MSARALRRNHARAQAESRRRHTRRAQRASLAAGAALGATVLFAPSAQAAGFTVNQLTDAGDGTCDATCTLRDAVDDANTSLAADTITFGTALTGTIHLGGNGDLDLQAAGALTIADTGANRVTISGDTEDRIFTIHEDATVTLTDLTITDGYYEGDGGAIVMYSGGYDDGQGTEVVIEGSQISGSVADDDGGAIAAFADKYSSLEIRDTTLSGNTADNGGGGLFFLGYDTPPFLDGEGDPGTLTMSNSTVSGNDSQTGGGIEIHGYSNDYQPPALAGALPSGGFVEIGNTTIADNEASIEGGGINLSFFDTSQINNRASGGPVTGATDPFANVPLSSTIVADNTAGEAPNDLNVTGQSDDADFVLDHSLVENAADSIVIEDPPGSNIRGTDPELGPLADNGGITLTHLPGQTSPAIDAGLGNGLTLDQRGINRTIDRPEANRASSDGTDIGSVEVERVGFPVPEDCTATIGGAGVAFSGSPEGETVSGSDGRDIILGQGGNDTINGKPGDDCLWGGSDNDIVNGDEDDDVGRGNSGEDSMDGGSGDDDFGAGPGDDEMDLSSGNDHGIAGGGDDKATGGTGQDVIRGRAGDDEISGGDGADGIKSGRDDDEISGGDGNDNLRGGFGDDVITGGKGKDDIDCGKGKDTVIADAQDKVSKDCEIVK
jgi:Ca2+-binding RTX toxin-like protein